MRRLHSYGASQRKPAYGRKRPVKPENRFFRFRDPLNRFVLTRTAFERSLWWMTLAEVDWAVCQAGDAAPRPPVCVYRQKVFSGQT